MTRYRRIRRYGTPAIALHWLVALGIFVLFVHGATMMLIPEHARLPALNLHRSIGVVVFLLVLVRIAWRLRHPPPPMRMAHEAVAHYVHVLIYALLVGNGIAGTVGWLASGDPVVFFGWQACAAHAPTPQLARICLAVGFATARALLVAIALHALAALKHHVIDRDRLLERMWPGRTILVTLLSAIPALGSRKGGARNKHGTRRGRRARHDARHVATWGTSTATF